MAGPGEVSIDGFFERLDPAAPVVAPEAAVGDPVEDERARLRREADERARQADLDFWQKVDHAAQIVGTVAAGEFAMRRQAAARIGELGEAGDKSLDIEPDTYLVTLTTNDKPFAVKRPSTWWPRKVHEGPKPTAGWVIAEREYPVEVPADDGDGDFDVELTDTKTEREQILLTTRGALIRLTGEAAVGAEADLDLGSIGDEGDESDEIRGRQYVPHVKLDSSDARVQRHQRKVIAEHVAVNPEYSGMQISGRLRYADVAAGTADLGPEGHRLTGKKVAMALMAFTDKHGLDLSRGAPKAPARRTR